MKITDIHTDWGAMVEFDSPLEFFEQKRGFWRDLIYDRKLLIFKVMNFTKQDYAMFSTEFGMPWKPEEYLYSEERREIVQTDKGMITLSPFSNKTSKRLNVIGMPYHADIPNRSFRPFPFRSLWITSNPRPEISGKTTFLNIEQGSFKYLTDKQRSLLNRTKIIQQSWYNPGTDIQEHALVKVHPITGEHSLRLNYYNTPLNKKAWICGVKIDGIEQRDCSLVREFIETLDKVPTLKYTHTWDTYDILIYDNYSFVHDRSPLILEAGEERHFYRINIDHQTDEQFISGTI